MKSNYLKGIIAVTAAVLLSGMPAHASEMDQSIITSAKQTYVFKKLLKDDKINVSSSEGAVVLSGTVTEETHKTLAKETVANLPGVKSVDNQLTVKGPAEESDGWIGLQIKYSLLYNRHVSGLNTQVSVNEGIVTLKGEAANQGQKELAGEYAKDVKGVKDVKNEISIVKKPSEPEHKTEKGSDQELKPKKEEKIDNEPKQTMGDKIDDASITAQVKMAYLFHKSTSAFKTGVKTNEGIVTLTGMANNAAGKDMASKVANDVHGVISVVNNMTVKETLTQQ